MKWLQLTPYYTEADKGLLTYSLCAPSGDTPPEWQQSVQAWERDLQGVGSNLMFPTFVGPFTGPALCYDEFNVSPPRARGNVMFQWEVPEHPCPAGDAACTTLHDQPINDAVIHFTDIFRSMRTSAYPQWALSTANHEFGHVMSLADHGHTDCELDPLSGTTTLMGTAIGWRDRPPCVVDPAREAFAVVCVHYDYDCPPMRFPPAAAAAGPDSDGDGWEDAIDNCPAAANPLQENRDADSLGNACDSDDDNDGYNDGKEAFLGTDPLDNCPDTLQQDAWPPDFNHDGAAGLSDVLGYIPVYLTVAGDGHYNPRYDLNADGKIGLGDVLTFIPVYLTKCLSTQSEIIDAVKATETYRDVNVALADGFNQSAQYIPNRGAYFINAARVDTAFDLKQPEGLIYGPGPSGWRLMGVFYLDPVWSDPNPPAGFTGTQDVWSLHNNFCITSELTASENTSEAACGAAGGVWWAQMGHFLPAWLYRWNQSGVFQELNAAAN